jgi:hypothetical protein
MKLNVLVRSKDGGTRTTIVRVGKEETRKARGIVDGTQEGPIDDRGLEEEEEEEEEEEKEDRDETLHSMYLCCEIPRMECTDWSRSAAECWDISNRLVCDAFRKLCPAYRNERFSSGSGCWGCWLADC